MLDCKGKELHIDDEVVYAYGKNSDARLLTGKVSKIYPGRKGEECSVDSNAHILSFRIMKLENH